MAWIGIGNSVPATLALSLAWLAIALPFSLPLQFKFPSLIFYLLAPELFLLHVLLMLEVLSFAFFRFPQFILRRCKIDVRHHDFLFCGHQFRIGIPNVLELGFQHAHSAGCRIDAFLGCLANGIICDGP